MTAQQFATETKIDDGLLLEHGVAERVCSTRVLRPARRREEQHLEPQAHLEV